MQPLEEKLKLQRSHKDKPPLVSHKLPKKNTEISSFSHNQREEGDEEEDDDDGCARKEESQVSFCPKLQPPPTTTRATTAKTNQITVHSTRLNVLIPEDFLWFPFCPIFLALAWLPYTRSSHCTSGKVFQ